MNNNTGNGINKECWQSVNMCLSHFPHIKEAVLFGSRAKGTYKEFSDVDIALKGNDVNTEDLLMLQTEIDDLLLPYEFDFCIYDRLSNSKLKEHIDRRGVTVYKSQT